MQTQLPLVKVRIKNAFTNKYRQILVVDDVLVLGNHDPSSLLEQSLRVPGRVGLLEGFSYPIVLPDPDGLLSCQCYVLVSPEVP